MYGVIKMKTTTKKLRKAVVDQTVCVACGCCVKVCPLKAIEVFRGLYAKIDERKCVGCGKCAAECPASIISVREVQL
jgi:heterodisulfide reductase subunit A-like polyferredoxin